MPLWTVNLTLWHPRGHREVEMRVAAASSRAGLDAAMARGRQGGRKPVVTEEKLRRAQTLVAQGLTVREAATRIKVGKTALYAALAQTASEYIEGLP